MEGEGKREFLRLQAQTSPHPLGLSVRSAYGTVIQTTDGKEYLDLIAGIAVANVGHCHPRVVEAVQKQAETYMHVMAYGEFIQDPSVRLAKELTSLLPDSLNQVYFVNSGTEANEAAIKLVRRVTGRSKIVSCYRSYHGSTLGSLSVSGNEYKKYPFRPLLPDVFHIQFNVEEDLSWIDDATAAVLIEPIQGDAGVRIPDAKYLKALRKRCDETGALLIFDEVQTGFGRTGKLFAFEHAGVVPDVITLAKGMGGGLPIGALVSDRQLLEKFTFDPMLGHITTFGGNPVCCAAALASLEVVTGDDVLPFVEEKGQVIESYLEHELVHEVRRKGMMFAIDMGDADLVQSVVEKALENGLITFWFLSCPESFRLSPPLIITMEEAHDAGRRLREVFDLVVADRQ